MPLEFTAQSSPSYRSLETVLPGAQSLREQQRQLVVRRAEVLRGMAGELESAMSRGHDGVIMQIQPGWRRRALDQAGYQLRPLENLSQDAVFVYFGDRSAEEKAALLQTFGRTERPPTAQPFRPPSPPSPSVYARSVFAPPSPPPQAAPPLAPTARPPFDRGHTVPGPQYRDLPARPGPSVAFDEDVRGGNYTPAPGRRF